MYEEKNDDDRIGAIRNSRRRVRRWNGNAVQAAPQETAIAKNVEKFSKNSMKTAPIKRFTI